MQTHKKSKLVNNSNLNGGLKSQIATSCQSPFFEIIASFLAIVHVMSYVKWLLILSQSQISAFLPLFKFEPSGC